MLREEKRGRCGPDFGDRILRWYLAWEGSGLPLNYTRVQALFSGVLAYIVHTGNARLLFEIRRLQ